MADESLRPDHARASDAATATDFEALFEHAPCGYVVTRDDGTILIVNETFACWTGRRRDALIGTRFQTLLPIGDQILYSTHCIPQLGVHGAVGEVAIDVIAADGARRAALLSATRIPQTDTEEARVRLVVFGAHERRQYEHELLASRRRAEESEARSAAAEADLRHRVMHDSLTGLPNRPGLVERLTGLVHESDPTSKFALLFIDLDHFKTVNDSLGHAAGDQLLAVVAERLRTSVRETSIIARLGGDEFVVVEHITSDEQAGRLAQRLLDDLNGPTVIEGLEVVPAASIGVVVSEPGVTSEALLRSADLAMYQAKARGRNRWEQHDPTRTDGAADRLRLLGELRNGIDRGELRLHYQPRVSLLTGALEGVEALVRWQHPTRGLLSPVEFIGIAEEAGLIRGLGAWVLDEALAQARRWSRHDALAAIGMAVNLSARQLTDTRLVTLVEGSLERHGLDPARVTLEITETAVMVDPNAALRALNGLKSLGVKLSVDDFGTGYSSLTYLNRFPVDELKIDQSFVAGLGSDRGDSVIVASCIELAHAMGVHAVAEGVETAIHRDTLLALGCDLAQGYFYSRPLSPSSLELWSERHMLSIAGSATDRSPGHASHH